MKASISQYTEAEFLRFVEELYESDSGPAGHNDRLVAHFRVIAQHPAGSDLIYWPEPDLHEERSPEKIVEMIKTWRAENGLPGFKGE